MTGRGVGGQLSARSERPKACSTLRFGLGFDEAALDDLIKIEADTLTNFVNMHPRQRKWEVMMTSYLIVDLDIHNPEGLQEYQNNVPSFIATASTQQ
jgi:hypothetical protein